MSDREKLLGLVVGGLLAFFAVFGIFRSVQSGLRLRNNKIANLQKKTRQEEDLQMQGLQDANLVREFKLRSLDADPDAAHLLFNNWLDRQLDEVGMRANKSLRYNGIRKSTDDYKELTYLVSGEGNLQQVTDLLFRIQSADTLHRVERFSLRRGSDQDKLRVDINIAALSMGEAGAPKVKIGAISKTKLKKTLDEYQDAIVVRNIFSPANNAPKFESTRSQTVELGKSLDYTLKASDEDGHQLTYRLLEGPDDSANLKNRNLRWNPTELGEYEFRVEVEDNGLPSKRDVDTILVKVVPRRKETPKEEFDEATVTKLSGFVQGPSDPGPRIWLNVQSEGENLSLGAGDAINVGKWRGTVKSVNPKRSIAVLESENGASYELSLGGTLADAKLLKADEKL